MPHMAIKSSGWKSLAVYTMKVQKKLFTVHSVKTKSCSSYHDRTNIAFQQLNSHFGPEFESSLTFVQINTQDHEPIKNVIWMLINLWIFRFCITMDAIFQ